MRVSPVFGFSLCRCVFHQLSSSRLGKSSRAWAPAAFQAIGRAGHRHHRPAAADDLSNSSAFHQVGVPDHGTIARRQAAALGADVRQCACGLGQGLAGLQKNGHTPPASPFACERCAGRRPAVPPRRCRKRSRRARASSDRRPFSIHKDGCRRPLQLLAATSIPGRLAEHHQVDQQNWSPGSWRHGPRTQAASPTAIRPCTSCIRRLPPCRSARRRYRRREMPPIL